MLAKDSMKGKVALVTGASRGVGRGVALALGDAGATVYLTGRTETEGQAPLPGTIGATAADVDERGGHGVALRCDHADDDDVRAVVDRIRDDQGRLDVLVNNVFAVPDGALFGAPFWEQPIAFWDTMHRVGRRFDAVRPVADRKR
jgi:NAD(P)-dependent dehydrogenase (short-subunit alcohol dehydrogenase family)